MGYEQYSELIYHHPCRVFRDYFGTKDRPKALEELFYSALFAHFVTKTTGDDVYVQCPTKDPPDAKMLVPTIPGEKAGYRDIELFKAIGLKNAEDILSATKRKMQNKYYGEHYVLIGVLHPENRLMPIDVHDIQGLFEKEQFTLRHIFFIFPTIVLKNGALSFHYVLVQAQPTFTFMTVDLEELKTTCNTKSTGFSSNSKAKERNSGPRQERRKYQHYYLSADKNCAAPSIALFYKSKRAWIATI